VIASGWGLVSDVGSRGNLQTPGLRLQEQSLLGETMKKPWIRPTVVEVDLSRSHPDVVEHIFRAVMQPPVHGEDVGDEAVRSPELIEAHKQAIAALLEVLERARPT